MLKSIRVWLFAILGMDAAVLPAWAGNHRNKAIKKHAPFKRYINAIALSLLLLAAPQIVVAVDAVGPAPGNSYSSIQTVVLADDTSLDIVIANSPSTPPQQQMAVQEAAFSSVAAIGDVKITGVPAYTWSYGASATAGAMIAGYYDRTGLANMYTGPTNGGIMPLTNAGWGVNQCPLSATKNGLDGRTTRGHVDDYYVQQGVGGTDPYVTNGWTQHTIGACTGDYMKTSKWFPNSSTEPIFAANVNKDGAAVFLFSTAGDPVDASYLETTGYHKYDAGYGLKLFFESRGYAVAAMYNQYIAPFKTYGFTYEQYKDEIDADRPVMLHLSGHIVVGIGYNESINNGIIFHDLWDLNDHTMIWGGTYKELFEHTAVTIVTLSATNTYTLTYAAGPNGSITGSTAQTVAHGSNGTAVTAVPATNYHFVKWSDESTSNPRTDSNVTTNKSVTATFALNTYTLSYAAGTNGTITGSTAQTVAHGSNGTAVTAVPATNYHFVKWSDQSTSNPRTDSNVSTNKSVTATFAINTYTLTYAAGPNGTITGSTAQTVAHGSNGTAVTAVPATNYHFVKWSDESTSNPRTDSNVTTNKSVTATFALNTYTLSYAAGTNGTITGSTAQTVAHGSNGTAVTAVPATNYHFVKWSDESTSNPRTDSNVTTNKSVTATFALNTYTLNYAAGTNGTITGSTAQTVAYGSNGTAVTAVPATNYHFAKWSDESTSNPRTDSNVTTHKSVTATFAINTYTVTPSAGEHGTIDPATVQTIAYGSTASFTITPEPEYPAFVGGTCGGTLVGNIYTTNPITTDCTVAASFITYNVNYAAGPNGTITGTISQTVAHGFNGTAVTAVPAANYHFVKWSDESTSNPRTDSNVTTDISVTATFANTYTLSYAAGTNGTITGTTPQTVVHGFSGTEVTAVPATSYHFVKWSDESTSNPRTDSNVTTDIAVTAIFDRPFPWTMFLPAIMRIDQN